MTSPIASNDYNKPVPTLVHKPLPRAKAKCCCYPKPTADDSAVIKKIKGHCHDDHYKKCYPPRGPMPPVRIEPTPTNAQGVPFWGGVAADIYYPAQDIHVWRKEDLAADKAGKSDQKV